MGGYLSTYTSAPAAEERKTIVLEPSKPNDVDDKKEVVTQSEVKDLTAQIIDEPYTSETQVAQVTHVAQVTEVAESPKSVEVKSEAVTELPKAEEPPKVQEEPPTKQEQEQEPKDEGKKVEIDPVDVNKSADVVKKSKKKKNKH